MGGGPPPGGRPRVCVNTHNFLLAGGGGPRGGGPPPPQLSPKNCRAGGGSPRPGPPPLFYLYTPCFCGARGCRPVLSATATPAFSQDGRIHVSVLRPKSRPPDELRRTEAALRSVVVLRGVSRQPVDTGPAAIPVWCGCPVFSDVPVPCGRSDCVRSVFVCFCAADVSFWYESTRCGCLKRGKSTFEYPAAKYDFLTK